MGQYKYTIIFKYTRNMSEPQSYTKKEILRQIDELINMIRTKLNKSILLTSHKKLPQHPQPKSIVGGQLKDYQLEALSWMIQLANNGLSGILADDMGLGKTIQTISYWSYLLDAYKIRGKHLIVVPKNVLTNWKREIQKWCPSLTAVILPGTEQQREECIRKYIKPSKFDILIATYYSVQVAEPVLKKFYWQTLIVDEAHSIKNDQTYLATCLRRFKYKFTLLLTGTPLSNELKQLWSLLNFIVPDIFHDNELFPKIQESVNINCKDEQEKIKYQSQIASRFKAIISPFLLRRVKGQCNLGLKQKKQFTLFVSLTELQLKMYRNYLVTRSVYGDPNKSLMGKQVQLRKICSHPYIFPEIEDPNAPPYGEHLVQNCGKLKLLDKLLKKLLKQGHKVLIFCQFLVLIKILQDYCDYRKYKYKVITGVSSLEDRDQGVEQFGKDKQTNIFLISTRAGGIGLNLVAADVVVLYDMDWNPQMDKQATDRAYRIGQKNNVLVFKLITINTIEERMFEVQKYKLIWDELVIQKGGLVRVQQAEERFEKIDKDRIAGIGAEQVFKLQQDFDDKTIDEIIQFGSQKDKKKTQQIRAKLQKQIEKYGDLANPFQELQRKDSKLSKIHYEAAVVIHDNKKEKKKKLNWKQRQGIKDQNQKEAAIIRPKDYHFYNDEEYAKQLLNKISQSDSEVQRKQLEGKLRKIGFYDWSKTDYDEFIKANKQIQKQDYQRISRFMETKSPPQVKMYSQTYFRQVSTKQSLQKDYKKVCKAQEEFVKLKKYNEALQIIADYPPYLFNLALRSKYHSMNYDAIINLHFNQVKRNGINLSEYQDLLGLLIPSYPHKVIKIQAENSKKIVYTKLAQKLNEKTPQQVLDQLKLRYQKLNAHYNKDEKSQAKKAENKSTENNQENDSVQTALK